MAETKKYWKGIEELQDSDLVKNLQENEFASEISNEEFLGDKESLDSSNTSRRDFLKYVGFSTAAATLAACETPVIQSIPYVVAPEEIIPGIANYYASSYFDGADYASILVKTREGRPIKIENNKMAGINGGANARIHASVLNLYDATRSRFPLVNGERKSWNKFDAAVTADLESAAASGKQIVLLTSTVISPSFKAIVAEYQAKYENFKHVSYDMFSYSGKLDAYEASTGKRAFPTYKLQNASAIVSFDADFLGDWIGQNVSGDYAVRRKPGKNMSRHIQFESNLSLTGSNADQRHKLKPSQVGMALVALHNEIASAKGATTLSNAKASAEIKAAAKDLIKAGKNGLVVSGHNSADIETLVIAINKLLGNDGNVVDYDTRTYLRQGNDKDMAQLITDMNGGKVGALLMDNINPVYRFANDGKFEAGMKKVACTLSFTEKSDETASKAKYICAKHNYLESWGDAMPADGHYSLQQPVISPLFNTRQTEDCLLNWLGKGESYNDYVAANWNNNILNGGSWNKTLHDGVFASTTSMVEEVITDVVEEISSTINLDMNMAAEKAAARLTKSKSSDFEVLFYQKAGMGASVLANNPWLLELPDPVTRLSWDNYVTMSAADAISMELMNRNLANGALNGSMVTLKANGQELNAPVLIQPGQAAGTIGLAIGYGREGAGKAADKVGVNAFTLMNGSHSAGITISKAEGEHEFASFQMAHTMMGRKIVNEVSLDTYLNKPAKSETGKGWNQPTVFETFKGPLGAEETNLWDDFDHETGHMWNMSIDLNLCNGCGACVISCHSENNVPVVGKEEIRKNRNMHWLRIDRYYSSDMTEEVAEAEGYEGIGIMPGSKGVTDMFAEMEKASGSPEVVFQPVMCQHCNHAPCETVCPVAATTHSSEGLNQMTYNRCIGTRYCANNCPYKVRRFNWFEYHNKPDRFGVNYAMNDDIGKMVLNPDVTVRTRGVMEKCSFCIQKIQLGKLDAKKKGQMIKDGQVQTACQTACDTGAITFGDVNDKDSAVFKLKSDDRMYHLLEDVGTQPSVFYQTKVRNRA